MIKVSIVIPVYNMALFLGECLQSVRGQSLKDLEIICVNDGSTDDSLSVLRKIQTEDCRIKVLDQGANKGVSAARNRGISQARGMYLCFMDPDDKYPDSRVLETMYEAATSHGALICGGCFSDFNSDTGVVTTNYDGDLAGYVFMRKGL